MEPAHSAYALASMDWTGLLVVFLIFGGGSAFVRLFENWNRTRIELTQLRLNAQGAKGSSGEVAQLRETVASMQEEMRSLRDTTTQYDMSFDTALERVEQRVNTLERQNYNNTETSAKQTNVLGG